MAKITRANNKLKFQTGDIPTETDFVDFLDSVLSLSDDDISALTAATDLTSAVILIAQAGGLKKAASSLFASSYTPTTYVTQTGNYVLPDYTATDGVCQDYVITGNSTNTITVPTTMLNGLSKWQNGNGNTLDNTKVNYVYTCAKNGYIFYNTIKTALPSGPDVTAPTIVSAATNTAGLVVTYTYNEALNTSITPATTDFTFSPSRTVSSVSVSGSTVLVTVSTAFTNGTTLTGGYTQGTNKIQDAAGNFAANLSGYSVTNNVPGAFVNTRSLSVGASNQIPRTAISNANLYFSNNVVDSDFSVAFWFKAISLPGSSQYLVYFGSTFSNAGGWDVRLLGSNNLIFVLSDKGGSANRTAQVNAATSAGSWMRVVMTYKGSTGARNIYINGSAVAKTDGNSGTYGSMLPSSSVGLALSVGGSVISSTMDPATSSLIDQLIIVNKELSSTEVTEDYNGGDPATLTFNANRVFDARFENNLNDNSSNAYNMTSPIAPTFSTDKP